MEIAKSNPPLLPALASMTALQAIVSLALFAPGVLAPKLGISEFALSAFAFGCFATGVFGALQGGLLVARLGSFKVAAGCMAAVSGAMALGASGNAAALLLAGLVLGLAFGPETPASSAILSRLSSPGQRPLIFSIRQCGNQIGAIMGSLCLPALAVFDPRYGYMLIIFIAVMAACLFLAQSSTYDSLVRQKTSGLDFRGALALLRTNARIRWLAIISALLSAMQLGLNAYLVSFLVDILAIPHIMAGIYLGVAQAGGLVGRLGWGFATRYIPPLRLIAMLALGAAAFSATVAMLPVQAPAALVVVLAFGFGLTASGWNGVFLSEVARCAPEGRAGEATGAVLAASYTGLLLAPLVIAGLSALSGLRLSYIFLAACVFAGGIWLLRRSE